MSLSEPPTTIHRRRLDAHRRVPVDLDHLRRQTFGDEALQRRVLGMFAREAARLCEKLKEAETLDERRRTAHALVGSARNVGAFTMADIASQIERSDAPVAGRLRALDQAVQRARAFIAETLSG